MSRLQRKVRRVCACVFCCLVLLTLTGCSDAPPAGAPRFRAAAPMPGDGVTIEDNTDEVTIDITSERGMGTMEFQRLGPAPKTVIINLHLKGLEEMTQSWGDTRVLAHVASGTGTVREEMGTGGGPATEIDRTSQYWMPVKIEGEDQKIPLTNGYFAVTASPEFIQAAPQRFLIKWIDFYR